MRGDSKLDRSIRGAQSWRNSRFDAEVKASAGSGLALTIGQSFSGKERNRLFFSKKAEKFADLSALSGLDNIADSRVLALWDFDRDGWQDMAVVNANAPLLNIYRNELGDADSPAREAGQMIAIRFVGGSRSDQPSSEFGNRDGYGARVAVRTGEFRLIREYRCGEGMAGQNSGTMIIGIGENDVVDSVDVRWLSGIEEQIHDIPAGTLVTVYEDPQSAPEGVSETREPYVVPSSIPWQDSDSRRYTSVPDSLPIDSIHGAESADESTPKVRLYTTMATWCAACKGHLPQIQQLRSRLDSQSLGLYGVPVDADDDADKLTKYEERYQPAYSLLKDLSQEQRQHIEALVTETLKTDALPSSVVTDDEGSVLLVTAGLPTVSELRKLLRSL